MAAFAQWSLAIGLLLVLVAVGAVLTLTLLGERRILPLRRGARRRGQAAPRAVWIVHNPSKHADPDAFRARLDAASDVPLHWIPTSVDDPGTGQTLHALAEGADLVIAAGGDGTVRAVAAGLAHSGVPLGIIPCGTGNVLARNLHLPIASPERALACALDGEERALDLGWLRCADLTPSREAPTPEGLLLRRATTSTRGTARADEYAWLVIAGLGFDADTMATTDPALKRTLGWAAYVAAALTKLQGRRMHARVTMHSPASVPPERRDGAEPHLRGRRRDRIEEVTLRARSVMFANCGELPHVLLAPDARTGDGLLDLLAVDTRAGLAGWGQLAWKVVRQGLRLPPLPSPTPLTVASLRSRQAVEATVTIDRPTMVQVDGDAIGAAQVVHARIDAGALSVRVAATTNI